MSEWIYAGASMFWLVMLMVYSRRWKRAKGEFEKRISDLEGKRMQEQAGRNVSDARLSMIRHIATNALKESKGPYRSWAISPVDVLSKVRDTVNKGLAESFREVGHFRDLMEATEFINTLPRGSDAYCFPYKMWDGDCIHVVYGVPKLAEMPPDGIKVLK